MGCQAEPAPSRDILSDPNLNKHSGLDCNKDSKEAICEILDNLDAQNNKDETELDEDEKKIKTEENTVATYTCDCTMGPGISSGIRETKETNVKKKRKRVNAKTNAALWIASTALGRIGLTALNIVTARSTL